MATRMPIRMAWRPKRVMAVLSTMGEIACSVKFCENLGFGLGRIVKAPDLRPSRRRRSRARRCRPILLYVYFHAHPWMDAALEEDAYPARDRRPAVVECSESTVRPLRWTG